MANKTKHEDRSFTASYDLMVKHGKEKKKTSSSGFGKKYHITWAHLKIRYLKENWFMCLRSSLLHHTKPALLGSSYFTDLILVVIRFDSLNWKRLTFSCSQGSVCMAIMVNELSQFLFPLKQKKTATIRRRRRRGRTTPPHEARGNEATK